MRANFDAALAAVLKHEGGFVCHPKDPGGATNKGVTQTTYDLWRIDHGLPKQSVKCITPAEICAIYKGRYWDKVSGDKLPSGLDYATFDFGVNSGPKRAAQYLQRLIGVIDDGKIGPATLEAVEAFPVAELIDGLCNLRQGYVQRLGTFAQFGRGWTRRIAEVRERAKGMA